jgi:hypothetical protein
MIAGEPILGEPPLEFLVWVGSALALGRIVWAERSWKIPLFLLQNLINGQFEKRLFS